MAKPDWIVEEERNKAIILRGKLRYCRDCAYYGRYIKRTKRKGGRVTNVYECDLHSKCLNTKFSLSCEDWMSVSV